MAVLNVRIDEALKRKLANLAKSTGSSQSELVKSTIAERLAVHQAANAEATKAIPEWVPNGKYVAIARGAVAAVGDSVTEVVADALIKFRDDPIHISRKGKPIKPVHYAFFVESHIKCWKYTTVDGESYPVIPTTVIGKKEVATASSPDTAASLTLVGSQIVDEADLQPAVQETVFTAAGPVKMRTFKANISLPIGSYDTIVASSEIPKTLPFQILLGRNLLDFIDLYALGKSKVVCIKDP